jgi:hypothetical protein
MSKVPEIAASRSLPAFKKLLTFLDMVPEHLKVGPWSSATHLVILSYLCFLLLTLSLAIRSYTSHDYSDHPNEWIQTYRLLVGVWGLASIYIVYLTSGIWPLGSYTLTSWNLMTLRMITSYLSGLNIPGMSWVADLLRYPALIGCTITVSIWWLVLVPLIDLLLQYDKKRDSRAFFWKFNLSPMLLNVHLLNLPLVAIEFLHARKSLNFFDLWVGLAVALLYCIFYLNVMDPLGLHFYIIFSPRTVYCVFSYILIIAGYWAFYEGWNQVLDVYHQN